MYRKPNLTRVRVRVAVDSDRHNPDATMVVDFEYAAPFHFQDRFITVRSKCYTPLQTKRITDRLERLGYDALPVYYWPGYIVIVYYRPDPPKKIVIAYSGDHQDLWVEEGDDEADIHFIYRGD